MPPATMPSHSPTGPNPKKGNYILDYPGFTFRLNEGNVARHTFQRLDSFIDAIRGKRITYKQLIGEVV